MLPPRTARRGRSARRARAAVLATALLVLAAWAPAAAPPEDAAARFDAAWRLVWERYWDLDRLEVDWQQVRERFRPRALAADDEEAFYGVLESMYEAIGDRHSVFVPPRRVAEIREQYGDLPCVGVFSRSMADPPAARGEEAGGVSWWLDGDGVGTVEVADLASAGVAAGVRSAVGALERRGARGLVLDLRGNPGGRLVSMMQVTGVFQGGFLWRVLTDWTLPLPYPALGGRATDLPLAVLIDGKVNSAAEGLAGALRRSGRAVTVGERTAGNVEAVLPFCLRDGSQAWIATGVLAPIGAPSWEGEGVRPDLPVPAGEAPKAAKRWLLEQP